MNKKGWSFFIFGIYFVVFMGVLAMFMSVGFEFIAFESHAGKDAQIVSTMEYDSYHIRFYIETLFRSDVLPLLDINSYLLFAKDELNLPENNSVFLLRNDTVDFFLDLNTYELHTLWATTRANELLQSHRIPRDPIFEERYNLTEAQQEWLLVPELPIDFIMPEYHFFLQEERITGFSQSQKEITTGNSTFYYWPHFFVYTTKYAELLDSITSMIDYFLAVNTDSDVVVIGEVPLQLQSKFDQYELVELICSDNFYCVLVDRLKLYYIFEDVTFVAYLDVENEERNTDSDESSDNNLE